MFQAFRRLLARLFHWRRPPSDPLDEAHTAVRVPRGRGPAGRSAAVALMEPEPPADLRSVGRRS
jgi:hypothetical protein